MRSFAIIGLGQFGKCMLESLVRRRCDTLVIDHDEKKIEWARDVAMNAYKADALNVEALRELLPPGLHCAVVDLGEQMEPSILVANQLHKLEVRNIVVQALSPAHAEILRIVGATKVIFPEQEAAERVAGMLAGFGTLDYFPIGGDFSVVEVPAPPAWVNKSLVDLDLRKALAVNVIAFRKAPAKGASKPWALIDSGRPFEGDDILLLAGTTKVLDSLTRG